MKKFLLVAALAAAAYFAFVPRSGTYTSPDVTDHPGVSSIANEGGDAAFARAFRDHSSRQELAGQGTVVKILSDDTEGSRHQRFILELRSGQTLLVAHNIDLAQRIASLREGDTVAFYGEYEWSPKGGVVHWTHRDPKGRHPSGWIKHDGQTYQ